MKLPAGQLNGPDYLRSLERKLLCNVEDVQKDFKKQNECAGKFRQYFPLYPEGSGEDSPYVNRGRMM